MVQVINVDVRRLFYCNAATRAEAPESCGARMLVVVVHPMRHAHVGGWVVRHCRHRNKAILVGMADGDHRVRDRPRARSVPVDVGDKVHRHRGEYGTGTGVVNVNGCIDCEGPKEDRGHGDHTDGKHVAKFY